MNPSAERIYAKVRALQNDKGNIESRLKQLSNELDNLKKQLHRTEADMVLNLATAGNTRNTDVMFVNETREINTLRTTIKAKEKETDTLKAQLKYLDKQIEHTTFWLHQAETSDTSKQQEAERAIFG